MFWRWGDQRSVEFDAAALRWRIGSTSIVQPAALLLLGAAPSSRLPT
jgi:hypothetical protein